MHELKSFVARLGALRTMLLSVLLALIVLGPFAGGPVEAPGASVLLSVVAPAFYVIMLFVLPLDITMSSVFMSDKQGEERARFRFIIRTEVAFFVVMLLAWLPFVIRLLKSVF
jgi:hypothetical protein